MDKQNFYQEKYGYYRTLNLWAVFGISIPSIGYFFSDCYLLGGFSTETLISRSAIIIPFLIYLILNKYTKDYRIMVPMSYAIGHSVMWCTIWACTYLDDLSFACVGFFIILFIFMERGEDFDYIGLSYYPFWHGTLQMLEDNMNDMAARYGKELIVAEVSMGYTMEDYKQYEKLKDSERKGYATKPELVAKIEYPMTVQGQVDFTKDFLNRVAHVRDNKGLGFFWWEPAWIPVHGSGWATPASLKYMNDPGPCGNEWANQALFDYDGNVLPALEVIRDFRK